MTKINRKKKRSELLFRLVTNPLVFLGVPLLVHGLVSYLSSFFPAWHEVYSNLPITNLDFPREVIIVLAIKDLMLLIFLALIYKLVSHKNKNLPSVGRKKGG